MKKYIWLLLAILIVSSCTKKEDEVIIAISKASGNPSSEQYKKWIIGGCNLKVNSISLPHLSHI